jgi:hypothetical protein
MLSEDFSKVTETNKSIRGYKDGRMALEMYSKNKVSSSKRSDFRKTST